MYFKRPIDFILSLFGLIVIFPVLFVFSFLLFLTNHGSPFYYQERPGKDGEIFYLIKFKTMNDKRDHNGLLLPDMQRLTSIGRFMRSFSLDEFPQLINVLRGEMSLIGPRPLLVRYLPLYNVRQARRHEVRPGMSCLPAVNGRNLLSWEEKFEMDVWYIDHLSFFVDLKILGLTLAKIFKREGINASENEVSTPFYGES